MHYILIAIAIALIIYSIVLHEVAHGMAAYYLGDPTAKMMGRLSLNPKWHIDPVMTIIVPLLTYFFAGVIFGGAKPVPVNPRMFRDRRRGMMITALAGPATNVLIVLTCAAIVRLCSVMVSEGLLVDVFYFLRAVFNLVGFMNMILVAFNLLPVPPLDGSRVVAYLLPPDLAYSYEKLERYGMFLIMLLLMTGVHRPVLRYAIELYVVLSGLIPVLLF